MAKTNYQSIDEYHQSFSGETLERMVAIRKIIRQIVPEAEESISYQIPCFKYHGYLLYYASFPHHITLSHPFSQEFWDHFRKELENYKKSKAAIQLPLSEPLPAALIRDIVAFRRKENEERSNSKKVKSK